MMIYRLLRQSSSHRRRPRKALVAHGTMKETQHASGEARVFLWM